MQDSKASQGRNLHKPSSSPFRACMDLPLCVSHHQTVWPLQELAAHVRNAATQVKSERKRREGAEKELKAAHEARTQAAAAAAKAGDQIQAQQAEMDRWQKLAEERSGLVVQAENAAIEMRQACDKQVLPLSWVLQGWVVCMDDAGWHRSSCGLRFSSAAGSACMTASRRHWQASMWVRAWSTGAHCCTGTSVHR